MEKKDYFNKTGTIDTEKYPQLFEKTEKFVEALISQSALPKYSFEEPFSHTVTSMSKCIRYRWLEWMQIEPKKDPKEPDEKVEYQGWAAMGNAVEKEVIDLFKIAGVYRGEQIRVKLAKPNISGMIDLIIEAEGKFYIVEIKSCNSYVFQDKTSWVCPMCNKSRAYNKKICNECGSNDASVKKVSWHGIESKPKFDHYCQIQMYMAIALSNPPIIDDNLIMLDEGIIFYYEKNTSKMAAHKVQYDEDVVKWQFEKLKELEDYISKNECPERQYTPSIDKNGNITNDGDWQCRPLYCKYSYHCWQAEIEAKRR